MLDSPLHKAQVSILYSLRHTEAARYSQLMRPTGLESDVFKFHLRSLVERSLVVKRDDGSYTLSPAGKEFANNLDDQHRGLQKQPKLTLRIYLTRHNKAGETEYLLQERRRNPYWGYWDTIGGPVSWGEDIADAADRELRKQTGLSASFSVKAFYRVRDFDERSDALLEDKLFAVVTADHFDGKLQETWQGGRNTWMTLKQLLDHGNYFQSTPKMIELLETGATYGAEDVRYTPEQY